MHANLRASAACWAIACTKDAAGWRPVASLIGSFLCASPQLLHQKKRREQRNMHGGDPSVDDERPMDLDLPKDHTVSPFAPGQKSAGRPADLLRRPVPTTVSKDEESSSAAKVEDDSRFVGFGSLCAGPARPRPGSAVWVCARRSASAPRSGSGGAGNDKSTGGSHGIVGSSGSSFRGSSFRGSHQSGVSRAAACSSAGGSTLDPTPRSALPQPTMVPDRPPPPSVARAVADAAVRSLSGRARTDVDAAATTGAFVDRGAGAHPERPSTRQPAARQARPVVSRQRRPTRQSIDRCELPQPKPARRPSQPMPPPPLPPAPFEEEEEAELQPTVAREVADAAAHAASLAPPPPAEPSHWSFGVQTEAPSRVRKPPCPQCAAKETEKHGLLRELTRTDREWREMVVLLERQLEAARSRIGELEGLTRSQHRQIRKLQIQAQSVAAGQERFRDTLAADRAASAPRERPPPGGGDGDGDAGGSRGGAPGGGQRRLAGRSNDMDDSGGGGRDGGSGGAGGSSASSSASTVQRTQGGPTSGATSCAAACSKSGVGGGKHLVGREQRSLYPPPQRLCAWGTSPDGIPPASAPPTDTSDPSADHWMPARDTSSAQLAVPPSSLETTLVAEADRLMHRAPDSTQPRRVDVALTHQPLHMLSDADLHRAQTGLPPAPQAGPSPGAEEGGDPVSTLRRPSAAAVSLLPIPSPAGIRPIPMPRPMRGSPFPGATAAALHAAAAVGRADSPTGTSSSDSGGSAAPRIGRDPGEVPYRHTGPGYYGVPGVGKPLDAAGLPAKSNAPAAAPAIMSSTMTGSAEVDWDPTGPVVCTNAVTLLHEAKSALHEARPTRLRSVRQLFGEEDQ